MSNFDPRAVSRSGYQNTSRHSGKLETMHPKPPIWRVLFNIYLGVMLLAAVALWAFGDLILAWSE